MNTDLYSKLLPKEFYILLYYLPPQQIHHIALFVVVNVLFLRQGLLCNPSWLELDLPAAPPGHAPP